MIGKNCNIDKTVKLGNNVSICNNVTIYPNVVIEDGAYIWDNCVIGRVPMGVKSVLSKVEKNESHKTTIGKNSVIGCNTTIYSNVRIGNDTLVSENVVIRERTILAGNNIIGPNSFIQKDCFVDDGTRMIQQSALASGTHLGKNNFLSSGFTCVSDRTFGKEGYSEKMVGPRMGDRNLIGPNVTILDNIVIGDDNTIGACALITKSIENNSIFYGAPAKLIRKKND